MKECKNCKSSKPIIYPLHCGDPNREIIIDGLCQQDQQRHDADDCYDKFEEKDQNSNNQSLKNNFRIIMIYTCNLVNLFRN